MFWGLPETGNPISESFVNHAGAMQADSTAALAFQSKLSSMMVPLALGRHIVPADCRLLQSLR